MGGGRGGGGGGVYQLCMFEKAFVYLHLQLFGNLTADSTLMTAETGD